MNTLLFLAAHSLRRHAMSTVVTAVSAALAVGLTLAVFGLAAQTRAAFMGGAGGFDAVLGARGSQLQLVLNAVFHLETSPGNIPWSLYQTIKADPRVSEAVPYAVGDNYFGYRIVGTTLSVRDELRNSSGKPLELGTGGKWFDEGNREAVVGSVVAQQCGLNVGGTFRPYHGLAFNPNLQHEEVYQVVGILKPSNTPIDRVIFIPLEGLYRMKGHVLRGTGKDYIPKAYQPIPDHDKELSAVLLKLKDPQAGFNLDYTINKQGKVATLAWPIGRVMADLFNRLGWMSRVLALVAYLVMVVAACSILAALHNTMRERRREFAILRALGARRRTVFASVVTEAAAIAGLGALGGYVVYGLLFFLAAGLVRAQTGVVVDLFFFHPALIAVPLGMTLLGALAGIWPATQAYSTDVAGNLEPHS
ncbi:MAG TPA: FtsX-like permease family protein [bacterium]